MLHLSCQTFPVGQAGDPARKIKLVRAKALGAISGCSSLTKAGAELKAEWLMQKIAEGASRQT